ncbi:MAG: efflux RND transporter permease subunit, partial [Planctomycetes bacterium]|nr:efflux RND transporter permease subunit [Planctomycetota bacterium]
MGIIRFAINNPVKVAVGVILLTLFGVLSVFAIPIQLIPNVDQPQITVKTFWEGASPQEIEREIIERQEEKLKGVSDLKKMTSTSIEGNATIVLEFFVGTDKDASLRDVSDKLRQVSGYPNDVNEPTVQAADAALNSPIAWLIFTAAPGEDPSTLKDFAEDKIKPILERAQGVASIDVYGGREREVQIRVDVALMAARGVTFRDLENALRQQNKNISAGTIASGKRDYTWRTLGQFETLEQVENTVIAYGAGGPVYVKDIAKVVSTYKKQYSFVRSVGKPVLAMPVRRQTGSNVIEVMRNLGVQIEKVNREILEPLDRELVLTQLYDETVYIRAAINLVLNNLLYGGAFAVIILLLFLRSGSATAIVALCIPISVVGSFLVVTVLGRTMNVVMLAGMAFAVGMVVDNSIVVLENIYRHRQMGKDRFNAALDGAVEVWGAVLASTLTTMAVFLPVVFLKEEAGQLFQD